MEKKKVDVLEQMQNMTIDLNSKALLEKAEKGEISYAFEIYDNKILNDYKGNVMATAPYSFYTKESIDRLVDLWCSNIISILNNSPQNVVK